MFGPVAAMVIADPELRIACIQAYNAWLIEFCAAATYRLLGVAILPLEDRPGPVLKCTGWRSRVGSGRPTCRWLA